MLDSAAIAVFTSAADDFLRAQELVAESGHELRPGLLELLKSSSDRIGDSLKSLPPPFRALRYRGMTFYLIPGERGFSLAAMPEAQVLAVEVQQ